MKKVFVCLIISLFLLETIITQSNNQTNTSNNTEPNVTKGVVVDKPTIVKSKITPEQNETIRSYIEFKDGFPRYKSNFDPVTDKIFAPEKDYYQNSINMMGIPLYGIGTAVALVTILVLILYYVLGCCGGKKDRDGSNVQKVKRSTKMCIYIFTGTGAVLCFCGIIVSLVGGVGFEKATESAQDSLSQQAQLLVDMTRDYQNTANEFNDQNLTNGTTGEIYKLDLGQFQVVVDNALDNQQGSQRFQDDLGSDKSKLRAFVYVFFVFSILLAVLYVLTIVRKLGSFIMFGGLGFLAMSIIAWIMLGFWVAEIFKMGDICQNNQQLLNAPLTHKDQGVLFYFDCLSSSSQMYLNAQNFKNKKLLEELVDEYKYQLTSNNKATEADAIHNQIDVINRYKAGDDSTIKLADTIGYDVERLNQSLHEIEDLRNCNPVKQYAVDSELEFCANGLYKQWLGTTSFLILAIAFLVLGIGGIKMRAVLEDQKAQKESLVDVGGSGGYI